MYFWLRCGAVAALFPYSIVWILQMRNVMLLRIALLWYIGLAVGSVFFVCFAASYNSRELISGTFVYGLLVFWFLASLRLYKIGVKHAVWDATQVKCWRIAAYLFLIGTLIFWLSFAIRVWVHIASATVPEAASRYFRPATPADQLSLIIPNASTHGPSPRRRRGSLNACV